MNTIATDIKSRIFEAADRLYEGLGRESFPTVDAVRREAKTDMNAASAAMKEWRKAQTAAPVAVAVAVPETLGKAAAELIADVWTQATGLANESLKTAEAAWAVERTEADTLRSELAESHDAQTREIEGLSLVIAAAQIEAKETAELHQEQVNGLTQQLQDTEQNLHGTRESLAKKEGQLEGVSAQLVTVEGTLTKTEAALTASEQHSKTLQEHSKTLEQQLQELRDKNARLQADFEKESGHRQDAENEAIRNMDEVNRLIGVAQAAQEKAQVIDDKLRALEVHSGKLEGKNETLEQQLAALHKTFEKQVKAEPEPDA